MDYREKYQQWLNHPNLVEEVKKQLREMTDQQIKDAFYTDVAFGTAGMRGLMGYGPNRLNIYTIRKATQGFAIGYNPSNNASIEDESLMISVDFNFVNVDFYVEYRVTDPVKYLYNSRQPVNILKMICQSYIRDTIGLYGVDDVITTGKAVIQSAIRDKITARLEQEDLGITLVNIAMQDAEPPTAEVQQAFKAVETSKQEAETAINNANKYANEQLPAAKANADQILQQAEAYKESRIAEAQGQASRFRELYQEYARFPEIGAVVHTHSPCATAFAAAGKPIPECLIEMRFFLGGEVPCAGYARPGTREVGLRCAEVLDGRGGCLMQNHGALAVGKDLEEALLRAEYVEDAAKIALLSMGLGGPILLPEEE